MIGFYDYTVILTYGGLLLSLMGILQAMNGAFIPALLCMGGALVCDTLDGKVARSKRNRTRQESLFGVQIDSLCDVISFGVFPGVMCYCLGLRNWYDLLAIGFYCLCCVIRLGYFNVLATEAEPGAKAVFHGLPVVFFAVLFPAVYMTHLWLPEPAFMWVLRLMVPVMGILYILDFQLKKPRIWLLLVLAAIFWGPMAVICLQR